MDVSRIFYASPPAPDTPVRPGKGITRLFLILFIPLSLLLLLDAGLNMKWRMYHDAATMTYFAFLINHFHWVPYRDLFEMNMPGNHFFNALAGRIFGYSDLGFRFLDLTTLSVLMLLTWAWLRRLGWKVAWAAMAGFCFHYYALGPIVSMQREFLLLVPLSASLVLLFTPVLKDGPKAFLIGLCFGSAFLIKPHIVLGYPVIFLFLLWEARERDGGGRLWSWRTLGLGAWTSAGFLLPVGLTVLYLWRNGALLPFLDGARNYWPLYSEMSGGHRILTPDERWPYVWRSYLEFSGLRTLFWPLGVGLFIAFVNGRLSGARRRQVLLMGGMILLYSFYAAFAGKFWPYHWLIFAYFLLATAALCCVDQPAPTRMLLKIFPLLLFAGIVFSDVRFWRNLSFMARGYTFYSPKIERGDLIADFLRKNLRPGDKVQPLDWTGGTHQAMLAARAELATPFFVDSSFYHHVSHPYIQKLRRQFIDDLKASKPRFIVEVLDKDRPSGPDTTNRFEELEAYIAANYRPVVLQKKLRFIIYERKAGAS